EFAVILDNVGTLDLALDFAGMGPEFLGAISALTMQVAEETAGSTPEEIKAIHESIGGEFIRTFVEQLEIISASIRFEDDSIAEKLLGMFAERQSTSRVVLASTAANGVLGAAAQAGAPPDFQVMLLEAVQGFLLDPNSFEITMAPAEPVPLSAFQTSGQRNELATLIDRLNISVTANQ
ncbi:MAG: hypothetical protein AAFY56_18875, partial [Pseudomonadota bacterium]